MTKNSVSIGIITLEQRASGLVKLLQYLKPSVESHQSDIEIIIANNSGATARNAILKSIENSGIETLCQVTLIDSPQNSIATGRNICLDRSQYDYLAFLDDDEFPVENWLTELFDVRHQCDATVVAGPVLAVFHDSAPQWVRTIDLHNTRGKRNASEIQMTGTGNVLINKREIAKLRFDEIKFAKSGGSDTDFFLRLGEQGGRIFWADKAIAYEDIPEARSTAQYNIFRFIKQGDNYQRISFERGLYRSRKSFLIRSMIFALGSLPIAGFLILIRSKKAGDWTKRAFSNYGKIHSPKEQLYQKP
jgi:succinoglycan biosynthesis protein ExoM